MGWIDNRKDLLDKRVALAKERKWWAVSLLVIAAGIFFNSAANIVISAVGLVLKAGASVAYGLAMILKALMMLIVKFVKWCGNKIDLES